MQQNLILVKNNNDIYAISYGAFDWIRTNDLYLRRATLYPAELRMHFGIKLQIILIHSAGYALSASLWASSSAINAPTNSPKSPSLTIASILYKVIFIR